MFHCAPTRFVNLMAGRSCLTPFFFVFGTLRAAPSIGGRAAPAAAPPATCPFFHAVSRHSSVVGDNDVMHAPHPASGSSEEAGQLGSASNSGSMRTARSTNAGSGGGGGSSLTGGSYKAGLRAHTGHWQHRRSYSLDEGTALIETLASPAPSPPKFGSIVETLRRQQQQQQQQPTSAAGPASSKASPLRPARLASAARRALHMSCVGSVGGEGSGGGGSGGARGAGSLAVLAAVVRSRTPSPSPKRAGSRDAAAAKDTQTNSGHEGRGSTPGYGSAAAAASAAVADAAAIPTGPGPGAATPAVVHDNDDDDDDGNHAAAAAAALPRARGVKLPALSRIPSRMDSIDSDDGGGHDDHSGGRGGGSSSAPASVFSASASAAPGGMTGLQRQRSWRTAATSKTSRLRRTVGDILAIRRLQKHSKAALAHRAQDDTSLRRAPPGTQLDDAAGDDDVDDGSGSTGPRDPQEESKQPHEQQHARLHARQHALRWATSGLAQGAGPKLRPRAGVGPRAPSSPPPRMLELVAPTTPSGTPSDGKVTGKGMERRRFSSLSMEYRAQAMLAAEAEAAEAAEEAAAVAAEGGSGAQAKRSNVQRRRCRPGRCTWARLWKACTRIVYPFEPLARYWDTMIFVLLMYCLWEIPLRLGLMLDVEIGSGFWIFSLCVDCVFLLDCFFYLTCRAHVDEYGYVIDDRKGIAQHYLKGWFTVDFLSALPLASIYEAIALAVDDTPSTAETALYVRLPVLLRAFRSVRLVKLLRTARIFSRQGGDTSWKEHENQSESMLKLFTTFVVVLYVGHFSGCVWAFVSLVSADEYGNFPGSSWANDWMEPNADNVDKVHLYFFSLYWAFETLSTVGYGDMLPTSTPELVWTTIVMLGGTCVFAYVIASLASLVTRADEQAEVKRAEIGKICTWMKHRRLDVDLRSRIRDHYEYQWRVSSVYDELEILNSIPSFLRTEVALFMYKDVLREVDFLHELGGKCLAALATALTPLRASPGQAIVQMHQVGAEMYIVENGVCGVYMCELSRDQERNQEHVTDIELETNDYFAEYCILYDQPKPHPFSVQASTVVSLLSLSVNAYHEVLRAYPGVRADLEKGSITQDLKDNLATYWDAVGHAVAVDDDNFDDDDAGDVDGEEGEQQDGAKEQAGQQQREREREAGGNDGSDGAQFHVDEQTREELELLVGA